MSTRKSKRSWGTRSLLAGLAELEQAVADGLTVEDMKSRFHTSVRVLVKEPGKHTPAKIRTLRDKIGASQADFAALVGVSRMLVQSWERGVRQPSPLARRLLDTIGEDPAAWLARVSGARRAG